MLSPKGVRSAVFKLRRQFREYIEEEVAPGQTCRTGRIRQTRKNPPLHP